jgi:hypothetical protein
VRPRRHAALLRGPSTSPLGAMSGRYAKFYAVLYRKLVREYGPLDAKTLMAIIGFNAGGPVSLCRVRSRQLYVTCELCFYPKQIRSTEGLRFELMSRIRLSQQRMHILLTRLSEFSFQEQLGDTHTIDVSAVMQGGPKIVRLELYSMSRIKRRRYGIYQVVSARAPNNRWRGP